MRNTPRRSSIRNSVTGINNSINVSRSTILNDGPKRRNAQSIRCPIYQSECSNKVFDFLSTKNYERLSNNILDTPSSKTFQSIFKFIVEHLTPFNFIRFEDETLTLLKQLKYPFISELNRSQMKAITPHSWPVLLSMLAWLVEVVGELDVEEIKDPFDELFFKFTISSYREFMEGGDEDVIETEEFFKKVDGLLNIEVKTIDELKKKESLLDEKLEALRFNDNSDILSQIDEVVKKEEKTIKLLEKVPSKIAAFKNSKIKQKEEIEGLNILALKDKEKELQETIDSQTIKPEEVVELTSLKSDLTKKLEDTKKSKEKITAQLTSTQQSNNSILSEKERLIYQISTLSERPIEIESMKDVEKTIESVECECKNLKDELLGADERELTTIEKIEDLKNTYANHKSNNSFLNSKLLSLGKLYLEKRDRFEFDMRKLRKEGENLDTKILRMSLNSRHSILSLEQQLESAQMKLDECITRIKDEQMAINKSISKLYYEISAKKEEVEELERRFVNLVKEN